jgi:hypothetical protein
MYMCNCGSSGMGMYSSMAVTNGMSSGMTATHVHGYRGATEYAGQGSMSHRHLVGASTSMAIPVAQGMHVHRFMSATTDNRGHYHKIIETSGVNVTVSRGNHVHSGAGVTTTNRGHSHEYAFTSGTNRTTNRSEY